MQIIQTNTDGWRAPEIGSLAIEAFQMGEIFSDPIIANAILGHLLFDSHIVNIVGPSYRTKDLLEIFQDEDHD